MRLQRRQAPVRPGPGTVPALDRQPRRPPHLGAATSAARLAPHPATTTAPPREPATPAIAMPDHRTSEYLPFNGFLLGYLLLETSAMTLRDPKPGDGSFAAADTAASESEPGRAAAADPVPGGLSPARSAGQREAVEDADSPLELIDPADEVDARRFPTVHRLAGRLARDVWEQEFESGLANMLDRIAAYLAEGSGSSSS